MHKPKDSDYRDVDDAKEKAKAAESWFSDPFEKLLRMFVRFMGHSNFHHFSMFP
jgi:hypothetical protein